MRLIKLTRSVRFITLSETIYYKHKGDILFCEIVHVTVDYGFGDEVNLILPNGDITNGWIYDASYEVLPTGDLAKALYL